MRKSLNIIGKRSIKSSDLLKKYSINSTGMININSFNIDYSCHLGEAKSGNETVIRSAHNVWLAADAQNKKWAIKHINKSTIGEARTNIEYPTKEAKRQAVLEVLAFMLGKTFSSSQFPEAKVATDGTNYYVATSFVENSMTIGELREANAIHRDDRDESPIYIAPYQNIPLRTKAHIQEETIIEKLKLSNELKSKIQREGYTTEDALVSGRINLKLILYILGEIDELSNRDFNTLFKAQKFIINKDEKTITPEIILIGIDLGLCLKLEETPANIPEAAFKLAIREADSNSMGLELDNSEDEPPTNLKKIKDEFLLKLTSIFEEKLIAPHLEWAIPHIEKSDLVSLNAMLARYTTCYLAGKCIAAGLDKPEKQEEATSYMKDILDNIKTNEQSFLDASLSKSETNVASNEMVNKKGEEGRSF